MSKRRRTSGGQAIVMVTLALFSMVAMMGLSVDLGYSYFVQKSAQAAADTAALGAAQEAVSRLGVTSNVSGFNCGSAGSGAGSVDCQTTPVSCDSVASSSNLHNGCVYASVNGFDHSRNARQVVLMQASDATDGNRPPGVNRISYWVRARTIQTVPQLFSFLAGNQNGTVAANATAAIAGAITPGSFYGMNRAGDCSEGGDCGLDFETGHGKGKGSGGSQACGPNGITSDFCAPAGIVLASSCGAGGGAGCDQNYAGNEQGAAAVGSSLTVMGPNGAVNGTFKDLNNNPLTAVHSTDPNLFKDPTSPNRQPPPLTSGASIGTCAIPSSANGTSATIPGNVNLGPYLYFSYHTLAGGKPVPDGRPITLGGNTTFSQGAGSAAASASCPSVSVGTLSTIQTGGAGNQANANFPTYVFVGGLSNGGTMNIGPGQYIMAGTNDATGGSVFSNNGIVDGTSAQAQATGSMFIFTDAAYPGLNLTSNSAANFAPLVTGASALNQGTVSVSGDITMYGLVNSTVGGNVPAALNVYSGVVWWQDRRNSTVGYNEAPGSPGCSANCTGDNGSVISCGIGCLEGNTSTTSTMKTANHVTSTSPGGVQFGNGNTKIALNGVYYQPRGAWTDLGNGNTGFNCPATGGQCPMQLITGALFMGSGNTRMVLAGPTNPFISYRAVLVQ